MGYKYDVLKNYDLKETLRALDLKTLELLSSIKFLSFDEAVKRFVVKMKCKDKEGRLSLGMMNDLEILYFATFIEVPAGLLLDDETEFCKKVPDFEKDYFLMKLDYLKTTASHHWFTMMMLIQGSELVQRRCAPDDTERAVYFFDLILTKKFDKGFDERVAWVAEEVVAGLSQEQKEKLTIFFNSLIFYLRSRVDFKGSYGLADILYFIKKKVDNF